MCHVGEHAGPVNARKAPMAEQQASRPAMTKPGKMLPEFSSYLTWVLLSDRVCDPASVNDIRNAQRRPHRKRLLYFACNMTALRTCGRSVLGHRGLGHGSPIRWSLSRRSLGRRLLGLGTASGIRLRMLVLENLDF